MPRAPDHLFELDLEKPRDGAGDAIVQLHRQLAQAIRDGRLAPGTRMPATRAAKSVFGVARNTAAEVYQRLLHEGLLRAQQGSGTYVAEAMPAASAPDAAGGGLAARLNPVWRDAAVTGPMNFWGDPAPAGLATPLAGAGDPAPAVRAANRPGGTGVAPVVPAAAGPGVELRPALVDSRLFPFSVLRRLLTRELRALETRPPSFRSAQGNQGSHGLRQAITRHIAVTRALACDAADVLVTAGAQQAFDLLARVLVVPGQTVVALENPGYPPLRAAFAAAGARLVPVPVDEHGLVVEAIPAEAAVICVTPSHQFPLGVTMSAQRRQELLGFARRQGSVIVEDDYDGEFRFDNAPIATLRTRAGAEHVFYVGTFSKSMLPSLRLGFIVAPRWALAALVTAKNCTDWHCSAPLQMGVAAFVGEGHLTRHVRRMRQLYRTRRKALLDGLRAHSGGLAAPILAGYGMHLTAWLPADCDAAALAAGMGAAGFRLHALERYYFAGAPRPGLVFGYGAADPAGLAAATGELGRLLRR